MDRTIDLSLFNNNNNNNQIKIEPMQPKLIDLSLYDENYPSICIPHVHIGVSEDFVINVINEMHFGYIYKVDMLPKISKKGICYTKVYIHFSKWHWNKNACDIREKLIIGNEIKHIYQEPYYFKFKLYKTQQKPFLSPINCSMVSTYEKEDMHFYNNYCNHYKKKKLFILQEPDDEVIQEPVKERLTIIIPTLTNKPIRPKSAPRIKRISTIDKNDI